jgi:hypothetical protein
VSRGNHQFSSVKTEGGLLPQDILARIQSGDPELEGTKAETYHLGAHERIGEAANQAWSRLVSSWHAFQEALAKEPEDAPATGLTRDRWLLPLFEILGYGRLPKGTAIEVEGKSYAVSHIWHHSPIHLLGCRVDLDTRQKGVAGAAMSSPHGLVQDFLNRSDAHLWGFVSNGYQLRVLRDHHSLTRQAYVEFDLQAIMDGEQYSEFLLLWLVCHQSRVEAEKPEECWLETWANISRDEGVSALDKLRDGVEKAIEAFGTGFLTHKANTHLRAALESRELDKQEYYRQILRLVYRLIFLFVAEERDALLDPNATEDARERYRRYYATRRIRDLADKRRGSLHGDLWRGIALVMEKLDDGYPELGLPALGSMLWGEEACPWLMDAECANDHVLTAVRLLSHIQEGKTRYPVNWRNVGADELGSIYESLLELIPRMNKEAGTFELDVVAGHERKTTGSYYTPTSLVDCLLDTALEPVLDEACKERDPEAAVLSLKVCDPACGSGHFLVAAARRIAKRLASVRSGDDEPSPKDLQHALRDVVGHCMYGVDLNPMAVELCKVSLWMEAIEPGKPLSFLDSHIQAGNALLGATPALMSQGIPDNAFDAIEGDDADVAKRLKTQNRTERRAHESGQETMFSRFDLAVATELEVVSTQAAEVEDSPDDDIEAIRRKSHGWSRLTRSAEFANAWFLADAWCSAFLWPKHPGELESGAITQDLWLRLQRDVISASQATLKAVRNLATEYELFHWHLAFPHVFTGDSGPVESKAKRGSVGGFDVVLGNPPWERIKLQEKEYFSGVNEDIVKATSAAARRRKIAALETEEPLIFQAFRSAKRKSEGQSHFIRASAKYPLCGRGDVNSYAVFAELVRTILSKSGRIGYIVPSGIATDNTTRLFFHDLFQNGSLVSFYEFENQGFFRGAGHGHMVRFALMTLVGENHQISTAEFLMQGQALAELADVDRRFELAAEDIELVNPNTRTCPIFRTRRDAEITKAVYRTHPVLVVDEEPGRNPWGAFYLRLVDYSDHAEELIQMSEAVRDGFRRTGWAWKDPKGEILLPVYESKLINQFDILAAHYIDDEKIAEVSEQDKQISDFSQTPRFLVRGSFYQELMQKHESFNKEWMLAYRDVTDSRASVRTVITTAIPRLPASRKLPILGVDSSSPAHLLVANFNSLALDYIARQKIGGLSLSFFIVKQLPILPPEKYDAQCQWDTGMTLSDWLTPRVLELTFTNWALGGFASDCGYGGPPFRWDQRRRFLLRCEIDAAFFHLYFGTPSKWGSSGREVAEMFSSPRDAVDYVLETFPIVKRRDEAEHGDYRTKLQVLEIYDAMQLASETGEPYQPVLSPLPADPRVAHAESTRPDWAREGA